MNLFAFFQKNAWLLAVAVVRAVRGSRLSQCGQLVSQGFQMTNQMAAALKKHIE
jgi:hypothetical protein